MISDSAIEFLQKHTEPKLSNYGDMPMFTDFADYVTSELLNGRDWQNLSSEIAQTYLRWGYEAAFEWVIERLTKKQYLEYLEEINEHNKIRHTSSAS